MESNYINYLEWRGDLTFEQSGLNEVDAIIFAQFSYLPLDKIVGEGFHNDDITIHDALKLLFKKYSPARIKKLPAPIRKCFEMAGKMMDTARFGDLICTNYFCRIDTIAEKQFAAVTILLDDDTVFVAFRGTDDTVIGWKEDFKLCYMLPVPSQLEAVSYMNYTADHTQGRLISGGHSKGGNLAVYSGCYSRPDVQERIETIYNFDGPGFPQEYIQDYPYLNSLKKIRTYLPQSSFVGMFLYHDGSYVVIKSCETGFFQHNADSWQVMGKSFVKHDTFTKSGMFLDTTMKTWLDTLSPDEKKQFVDALFDIMLSAEVTTLTQIGTEKMKSINSMIKSYKNLDSTTKKMLKQKLSDLIKASTKSIKLIK